MLVVIISVYAGYKSWSLLAPLGIGALAGVIAMIRNLLYASQFQNLPGFHLPATDLLSAVALDYAQAILISFAAYGIGCLVRKLFTRVGTDQAAAP